MIGQAAIGNPRIFTPHQPTKEEKLETILRHLDLSIACDQLFTTPLLKGGSDAAPRINCGEGAGGSNKLPEICIQPEHLHHHIQTNLKNPDFESHSITEFRKFLFQYVKGLPESRERKQEMLKVKKYGEVREMIQRFFEK